MTDWANLHAPTLDDFEAMANTAFEALPAEFRALCGDVPCAVSEFPDEQTIHEMELETEFDILGLFRGVGMPQRGGQVVSGQMPNQIWLYRRPILDYWADGEGGETLGEIIAHVLIHEIGHHFGFSDEDMEALEVEAGNDDGKGRPD